MTSFILLQIMSKIPSPLNLDKTLKWLDKTEGRDKFCKAIQYACRFLKYRYNQNGNKEMQKKIDALFCAMRDSRKLFRLFKSLKEYGKLLELLGKRQNMANQDFVLQAATRIFFLLYWLFDNLSILSKLGLISLDTKQMGKKGATCWFIALVATLILTLKNIVTNARKISELRSGTFKPGSVQGYKKLQQIKTCKKTNSKQFLVLVKTIGDMLPAGQGCGFYEKAFGFNVNEGLCGIGGLVSAIITSYELYQ